MSSPSSSGPPRSLGTRLARGFAACPSQAAAYGRCVVAHVDNISQGACEKEFAAFKLCFQQHIKASAGKR